MTEKQFLSSDDVRLVYDDFGPGDGVPVVLCHGLAVRGSQFHDDAMALAARGYRVLVPDLRGHGRSASPAVINRQSFSFARLGADLVGMLDDAGVGNVHWVGNSLGGIIGLSMLPAGRFLTLTTFGTAFFILLPSRTLSELWVRMSYAVLGRGVIARMMAVPVTRDPKAQRIVAEMIAQSRPEVTAALVPVVARYDFGRTAKQSGIPILLLDCAKDWLINWAMWPTLLAARGAPNITVRRLAAGGHCANLDAPEAFRSALLEFWRGAGTPRPAP